MTDRPNLITCIIGHAGNVVGIGYYLWLWLQGQNVFP